MVDTGVSRKISIRVENAGNSGDEGAADAIGALRRSLEPDGLQIDTHGRKNGHVQDRKNAFRDFFLRFEFESHSTKTKIQDSSAANTLIAENGVGICAGHGDAFGFAPDSVDAGGWRHG